MRLPTQHAIPDYGRGCDRCCWRKKPAILTWRWGGYLRSGGGAAGRFAEPLILKQASGVSWLQGTSMWHTALPVLRLW